MAVSAGLQKYFDGKRRTSGDVEDKLASMLADIDPKFLPCFEGFRSRLLDIVEESPDTEEMIGSELDSLDNSLKQTHQAYNLKKAAVIIDSAEAA